MDSHDKQLLLAEQLDSVRRWSYESLAAEIDRTANQHDCLQCFDGTFDDGTEYHMEFNVFWDDRRGGNVRVCGDIILGALEKALFAVPYEDEMQQTDGHVAGLPVADAPDEEEDRTSQ